jgi:diguanylate cyclase (GGDEF)-like protein/PAS domain S-box-containing protein
MTEQDEILIVDDDPMVVKLLTNILLTGGFQVWSADSGELALRFVASKPPGLILLDIGLPGTDGFEVCRRLKAQEDSRDIPVMFISGLTDLDVNVKGFGLGAVDFISKPFQREELLARVRTHLELSRLRTKLETQVAERTAQLRKSAEEIEDLYNNAPCGYHSLDENGIFQRINHTELRWLGYTRDELIGEKKFSDLIASENLPTFRENFSRLKTEEFVRELELAIIRKDGTTFPVLLNASVIYDSPGHYLMIRSTMFDITERKRAEEELIQSEERYRTILDNTQEGYFEVDLAGKFTFVNDAECNDLGYTREELIGMNYKRYTDETAAKKTYELFNRVFRTGEQIRGFEGEFIKKDGTKGFNEISVSLIRNKEGKPVGFRGLSRDITERKRLEEKLQTMSIMDDLTGLYNRRGFFTLAQQQMKVIERTKKDMLLFFADLDKMKQINDTLGHQEGDKALVEIATILKGVFRESDIIGRVGGDEFVILVIDTTDETREVLMKRLHNYLDDYNRPEGKSYTLSLSIGIAPYDPQKPFSLDELMAQADTLMYEEKKNKQH